MAVAVVSSGAYFTASGTATEVVNEIGARGVQQNQIIGVCYNGTNITALWRSGMTRGV